jgi:small subunit ribosomal protein S20
VNHFESGPTTQQFVSRTLDNQFVDGHDSRPYLFAISKKVFRGARRWPTHLPPKNVQNRLRSVAATTPAMVRTYIKNVVKAIDAKDAEKAQAAYVLAVPVIDRMADKGIIHKNKAARHKGRLNGHIKALNQAAAA